MPAQKNNGRVTTREFYAELTAFRGEMNAELSGVRERLAAVETTLHGLSEDVDSHEARCPLILANVPEHLRAVEDQATEARVRANIRRAVVGTLAGICGGLVALLAQFLLRVFSGS